MNTVNKRARKVNARRKSVPRSFVTFDIYATRSNGERHLLYLDADFQKMKCATGSLLDLHRTDETVEVHPVYYKIDKARTKRARVKTFKGTIRPNGPPLKDLTTVYDVVTRDLENREGRPLRHVSLDRAIKRAAAINLRTPDTGIMAEVRAMGVERKGGRA